MSHYVSLLTPLMRIAAYTSQHFKTQASMTHPKVNYWTPVYITTKPENSLH